MAELKADGKIDVEKLSEEDAAVYTKFMTNMIN
jgi:hypothetical protein